MHVHCVADLDEEIDGGLALGDAFKQLRVLGIALGQLGQLVCELEQQLQSILLGHRMEGLDRLLQGGRQRHRAGTSPGSEPIAIGTPTSDPHSVQEPS